MPTAEDDTRTLGGVRMCRIASASVVVACRRLSMMAALRFGRPHRADGGAGEVHEGVDALEVVGVQPS